MAKYRGIKGFPYLLPGCRESFNINYANSSTSNRDPVLFNHLKIIPSLNYVTDKILKHGKPIYFYITCNCTSRLQTPDTAVHKLSFSGSTLLTTKSAFPQIFCPKIILLQRFGTLPFYTRTSPSEISFRTHLKTQHVPMSQPQMQGKRDGT